MDILSEKEEIIRRFRLVHDADLIKAIKSLLDFGLRMQANDDIALKASIGRDVRESEPQVGNRSNEIMEEIRKRYNIK